MEGRVISTGHYRRFVNKAFAKKWWVSQLNFLDEIKSDGIAKEQLTISDCTLRDGEQQPGIVLRTEEKIQIAQMLDEVGIPEIEAGMPVVSDEEKGAVKAIAKFGLSARITCLCRALKYDIDAALECDVWGVRIGIPTSSIMRKYKMKKSEDETIRQMSDVASYAKDHGLYVIVSATDSTRTDLAFLKRYFNTVIEEAHIDHIRLPDSRGCIIPPAVQYLIREMRKAVSVPIEVHFHDDFGLATANTLAAVTAGAQILSTTINGIGERSGNAATEEVLLALLILYGIDLKMKYEKLYELSRIVQKLTNVYVHPYKAIVGENVFTHEAAVPIAIHEFPLVSEAYLPEVVGHTRRIVLGKKSGKDVIKLKLKELGMSATDIQITEILNRVKRKSEWKKASITTEEFRKIVRATRVHA